MRRSVQTALMVMMGSTGAVMATTVFRAKDTPKYVPGSPTSSLFTYLVLFIDSF